jgi:hypothetical protein
MACDTGASRARLILVVVEELASKEKTQAAPAWVVWEALADPGHPASTAWLDLADGEDAPQILEASRPALNGYFQHSVFVLQLADGQEEPRPLLLGGAELVHDRSGEGASRCRPPGAL